MISIVYFQEKKDFKMEIKRENENISNKINMIDQKFNNLLDLIKELKEKDKLQDTHNNLLIEIELLKKYSFGLKTLIRSINQKLDPHNKLGITSSTMILNLLDNICDNEELRRAYCNLYSLNQDKLIQNQTTVQAQYQEQNIVQQLFQDQSQNQDQNSLSENIIVSNMSLNKEELIYNNELPDLHDFDLGCLNE